MNANLSKVRAYLLTHLPRDHPARPIAEQLPDEMEGQAAADLLIVITRLVESQSVTWT